MNMLSKLSFCIVCLITLISLFPINVAANDRIQPPDSIYLKVDKVPVFTKNRGNVQKYLSKNITYPVDALAKEIEGKVLVSFIITKEGKLKDAKIEKKLYDSADKEAIRVVRTMQDWKPGKLNGNEVSTKMIIPVHFILSDDNRKIAQQIKPFYANDKPPLFVLDDKKVNGLTNLEYYNIKSIRVMKGEKAIALYGEEAINGVIIFETKRGTSPDYQMY